MVQVFALTFDLGDIIQMLRDSVRAFAVKPYETGAGTSEIRRMLIWRELCAETM
jgi:hypothetical protein